MLEAIIQYLACPHCGADLAVTGGSLLCAQGHNFDIARHGYASLLGAQAHAGTGDTAEMVKARAAFLGRGHYAPIASAVAEVVAEELAHDSRGGCIVDCGAGTGYYLATVLDLLPERVGIALDVSKPALRRGARAHDRMGAVACDVWEALPLKMDSAAAVIDIFAPRNAPEFARILQPTGVLVVVTPTGDHLRQIVDSLGLLNVDERKEERLAAKLGGSFERTGSRQLAYEVRLSREEARVVATMGPSAWHSDEAELSRRLEAAGDEILVDVSVEVSTYRPAGD